MKRILYNIGFVVFALIIPLIVMNWKFPLTEYVDMSTTWKVSLWGWVGFMVVFVFGRKWIVNWVKGFDKVSMFKAVFIWLVFVAPIGIIYLVTLITHNYSEQFLEVFKWTTLSHMGAGAFLVLAKDAKAQDFKKWVNK